MTALAIVTTILLALLLATLPLMRRYRRLVRATRAHACAPPAARRVAIRSLMLSAVCGRAHLELAATADRLASVEEADGYRRQTLHWLRREGLVEYLTAREQRWLETPVGELDEQSLFDSSWAVEGLAVLLWALGVADRQERRDVEVQSGELLALLPSIGADTLEFVEGATLRAPAVIRRTAEAISRRHESIRRRALAARPRGTVATGSASLTATLLHSASPVPDWSRALSISSERRRAFAWLEGEMDEWEGGGADAA